MKNKTQYIFISELPKEQQKDFIHWMNGQTAPVIREDNILTCAFRHDYDKFLRYWKEELVAPVSD